MIVVTLGKGPEEEGAGWLTWSHSGSVKCESGANIDGN
jgi:hypothetical protein